MLEVQRKGTSRKSDKTGALDTLSGQSNLREGTQPTGHPLSEQMTHLDVKQGKNVRSAQPEGCAMRDCWNWKTGTTKDRVSIDVWVQVPHCAPFNIAPLSIKPREDLGKGKSNP